MIKHVSGWSIITKYDDKILIPIANLVEATWLARYPRPTEITYDQRLEFIGHNFRKFLIEEEFGIVSKLSILVIQLPM